MEAKLKSLKVADLREICTRANVPTTTRSTKADLVTKILASQAAIDAYTAKYQPNGNPPPPPKPAVPSTNDDLLASPEDVDWSLEESSKSIPAPVASPIRNKPNSPVKAPPTPAAAPASPPKPAPVASETSQAAAPAAAAATAVDDELEKRKARAARFGIQLVEPSKPKPAKAPSAQTPKSAGPAADADPEKRKARAQRFGGAIPEQQTGAAPASAAGGGKKRRPAIEEVDAEEQERRRKRAERFGIPVVGAKA